MVSARTRRMLSIGPRVWKGRPYSMAINDTLNNASADRMSGCSWAVLVHLIVTADNAGVVCATLDQIANHVKYDRNTTNRAIRDLVAKKLLIKPEGTRGFYRIPNRVALPRDLDARNDPELVKVG